MSQLYMIGGPNGAGKTTVSLSLLPELLSCYEYVNADAIAAALSPFAPETTAIQAGRLMLQKINQLAAQKKDFAYETTMASKTFAPFLKRCKENGYQINLLYIWLENPTLAIARVSERVKNGGHHIPDDIVSRRYYRSVHNFLNIYLPLADRCLLLDNSFNTLTIIANKEITSTFKIIDEITWNKFRNIL